MDDALLIHSGLEPQDLAAVVLAAVGALVAIRESVRGMRRLRQLRRAAHRPARGLPPWPRRPALVEGAPARLSGTVVPLALCRSPLEGRPVVACGSSVASEDGALIDRTVTAEDFLLRLADGDEVLVAAKEAAAHRRLELTTLRLHEWTRRLLPTSPPALLCEGAVEPGDTVLVSGVAARAVDPRARAASSRGLPMLWTVCATSTHALAIEADAAAVAAP